MDVMGGKGNGGSGTGMSNSLGSLCGAFPECILEDSGFEEQEEFRTRCSSLVGRFEMNLISPDSKTVVLEKKILRHLDLLSGLYPPRFKVAIQKYHSRLTTKRSTSWSEFRWRVKRSRACSPTWRTSCRTSPR